MTPERWQQKVVGESAGRIPYRNAFVVAYRVESAGLQNQRK